MTRHLLSRLFAIGVLTTSSPVFAAAFQLWEQDGASIANYHAGYAAFANDASTAFYNPAGITRIKTQELVLGTAAIQTDFKYKGTIQVLTIEGGIVPIPVTGQGGGFALVPNLHYVAPLSERLGFGLSVTAPFGLQTNYSRDTLLRYAATKTSVMVVDISPAFGVQLTEKISFGAGIDIQRMTAEFNSVGASGFENDTLALNEASDTGYGYHLGGLYQFTEDTRVGVSYHSQVVHHLTGSSKFVGPLAFVVTDGAQGSYSSHATTNITLPPYTALSLYHKPHPRIAFMGTAIYTQWNSFKNLILNNISGIDQEMNKTTTMQIIVPEYYRNTWNFSVGADYYPTPQLTLRSGIGYDETPVSNRYRNVQLPDNNRYVFALGGHYQATKTIGLDLAWMHLFMKDATVNPPPQVTGAQTTTTNGKVSGGANVYGAQLTWDMV